MRQIEKKGYLAPWADSPKEKIAVGVSFSSEEKRVAEWRACVSVGSRQLKRCTAAFHPDEAQWAEIGKAVEKVHRSFSSR